MNNMTPEQRKASTAKSVATRLANIAKRKEEEEAARLRAIELRHGIIELQGQLDRLRDSLQKEKKFGEAIKKVGSGVLLREHEIIEHAIPVSTACGVYFLIHEKKVVYVGQSINVFSRIFTHTQSKEFDSYVFVPCDKDMLDKLESLYIHFLSPPLNGSFQNGDKMAPLRLSALFK